MFSLKNSDKEKNRKVHWEASDLTWTYYRFYFPTLSFSVLPWWVHWCLWGTSWRLECDPDLWICRTWSHQRSKLHKNWWWNWWWALWWIGWSWWEKNCWFFYISYRTSFFLLYRIYLLSQTHLKSHHLCWWYVEKNIPINIDTFLVFPVQEETCENGDR